LTGSSWTHERGGRVGGTAQARELQQLGIPKEHSDSICKAFVKDKEALQQNLVDHTLRLGSNQRLVRWQVSASHASVGTFALGRAPVACVRVRRCDESDGPASMRCDATAARWITS